MFIFLCFDQVKPYLLLGIMSNISSHRCTDLPLCVGWACVDVGVCVWGHVCVCVCACVCVYLSMYVTECVAHVCTRKLERAYLCMHVCSSVCMPLLRVCTCAFLYKTVSKQGIPTDSLSSFTKWKTKVKITTMNCWYRMTNLWIYEYKYKYIYI